MKPMSGLKVGLLSAFGFCVSSALAATVEVPVVGFTFSPADVTIDVGDSVHWSNLQGGFHTVAEVADGASLTWNGGFHSTPIFAGEFTQAFNTPGLYYYICEPHGDFGMRGTVTVNAAPAPALGSWGMVALWSAVLTAGGFVLNRRRSAIA